MALIKAVNPEGSRVGEAHPEAMKESPLAICVHIYICVYICVYYVYAYEHSYTYVLVYVYAHKNR